MLGNKHGGGGGMQTQIQHGWGMGGVKIAFACLYILRDINTHRKICPGHISPQNNKIIVRLFLGKYCLRF